MLKYLNYQVTFSEVPNEISLCINITNCPCHCKGCHSPYLAEDIGNNLDLQALTTLIDENNGITCVCIMGGDSSPSEVDDIAQDIKEYYPNLKVAWYSGRQKLSKDIDLKNFNFIKLVPYIEELGPLNKPTTNQRFYKVCIEPSGDNYWESLVDITSLFWKNND